MKNSKKILNELSNNKMYDIFHNMANLVEGKYKDKLLAATMLGQGKTIY